MPDFLDEAEVSQFHCCLLIDEHIFGLNVSVKEAVTVDIIERRCYLMDNVPDFFV